ncbi:MAG: hypothetical protein JFR38_09205 [Muribaculaceae bacterium]|nr:hypothetical protein [Muribaculaceae bacterium]
MALKNKEEIKREHFKSNDLKFLRIRVDFGGIPNIMDLVEAFKTVVSNSFGEMHRYEKKLLSSMDNTPELADLLDIDDAILRNTFVHSFTIGRNDKDIPLSVTVNISEYSIVLELESSNYPGFEIFKQLIVGTYKGLCIVEPLVEIRRIGIVKTSAFWSNNPQVIRNFVETTALPNPVVSESRPRCTYLDKFFWEEKQVNVSLKRDLVHGAKISEDGERTSVWQVSLLYDVSRAYPRGKQKFKFDAKNIEEVLDEMNDAHFELFKRSMTIKYMMMHCSKDK